jgi:hypothetical protein
MATIKLNPTDTEVRHLLAGTFEHVDPNMALAGLSVDDAFAKVGGYPHSIARLVAHMDFWQQRRLAFARGEDPGFDPDWEPGVTDFPEVSREDWPGLVERFLGSMEELVATAADPAKMELEVFDDRNVGFMLTSHACHNSYHLGQIVLMRVQLGCWQ